jgi:hypothetical protein
VSEQGPGAAFAEPTGDGVRWRAWLVPALVLVALLVILAGVVLFAGSSGDSGAPPRPDAFVPPPPVFDTITLDVQQVTTAGVITFANDQGERDGIAIPSTASIEVLRPASFADAPIGAAASLIGEPNDVRSFVVSTIVVFTGETSESGTDAGVRSAGGFEGWEAGRDQSLRVILSGTVTEANADSLVLETAAGPLTIQRAGTEDPFPLPLFLHSEEGIDAITSGARVAFPAIDGAPDPDAGAVLVLPR